MEPVKTSVAQRAAETYEPAAFARRDLTARGMTGRDIAGAVRAGALIHVRRDRYMRPEATEDAVEAVRIGGRLTCLSLLASMGVFVHRCAELHVFVTPGSSRLRAPKGRRVVHHWSAWSGENAPLHVAPLIDAVRHSVRCQPPRAAIATLDSLMHHALLTERQLEQVFLGLPLRFRRLRALVDASSASGPETSVRLMLRAMGVAYATQVALDGVGRVDFVVDGWLIIECDSREFHEGWAKQRQDRKRRPPRGLPDARISAQEPARACPPSRPRPRRP